MNTCKRRKRRTVKNAYVNVENVSIAPGSNYCNWIQLTSTMLLERESQLLNVKIEQIESIINTICHSTRLFTVNQDTLSATLGGVCGVIKKWKGVDLNRIKSPITLYRDYFAKGKKWCDYAKPRLIGDIFWIDIFSQLRTFVYSDKTRYLVMLNALFHGTVKYNNTRPQPLICGRTLLSSKKMQQFLLSLDHSLCITTNRSSKALIDDIRKKLNVFVNNVPPIKIEDKPSVLAPEMNNNHSITHYTNNTMNNLNTNHNISSAQQYTMHNVILNNNNNYNNMSMINQPMQYLPTSGLSFAISGIMWFLCVYKKPYANNNKQTGDILQSL